MPHHPRHTAPPHRGGSSWPVAGQLGADVPSAILLLWLLAHTGLAAQESEMPRPQTLVRKAKDTLTAIEMTGRGM